MILEFTLLQKTPVVVDGFRGKADEAGKGSFALALRAELNRRKRGENVGDRQAM